MRKPPPRTIVKRVVVLVRQPKKRLDNAIRERLQEYRAMMDYNSKRDIDASCRLCGLNDKRQHSEACDCIDRMREIIGFMDDLISSMRRS